MTREEQNRALAKKIAKQLFTNGLDRKADRFVLMTDNGRNLGGWCEEAVVDLIQRLIEKGKP